VSRLLFRLLDTSRNAVLFGVALTVILTLLLRLTRGA